MDSKCISFTFTSYVYMWHVDKLLPFSCVIITQCSFAFKLMSEIKSTKKLYSNVLRKCICTEI